MPTSLVLDNVVLSGFYTAGWFDDLSFWNPEYELSTPKIVWTDEFNSYHDYGSAPSWLEVTEIRGIFPFEDAGALSMEDWCCIILAHQTSGTLITRDQKLKSTAEDKGVSTMWADRFLLDTFEECGISEQDYEAGIDVYLDDAHIPHRVEETLKQAEKPN